MICPRCGETNEPDARYCDRCGVDLTGPTEGSSRASHPREATPSSTPQPLVVYSPARPRAWWYPIGVWVILSAFFVFLDLMTSGGIEWAYWPIGIIGIFMVGFPLLHLLEARLSDRR